MTDVYSIGFAIYFIAPPFLVWLAAYASADIFVLIGELRSDREIERDSAVTAMGILIAIASSVAFLSSWFTASVGLGVLSGVLAYFLSSVVAFARIIDAPHDGQSSPDTELVEFHRAIVLSALLSISTVVPVAIVVFLAFRG